MRPTVYAPFEKIDTLSNETISDPIQYQSLPSGEPLIYKPDDQARNIPPCQSPRTENSESKLREQEDSFTCFGVFSLHEKRRIDIGILQGKRKRGKDKCIRRRTIWGREFPIPEGILVILSGQVAMWSSPRQSVVSLSITEAEYIACSETAEDIKWKRQFLTEISASVTMVPSISVLIPILSTDSEAALKLIKTQTSHRRTRHIEHRYHYVQNRWTGSTSLYRASKARKTLQMYLPS